MATLLLLWETPEVMRLLPPPAAVAVLIGLLFGTAAPAQADDNDDDFLAGLRRIGIDYSDPDATITEGKSVCQMADEGKSAAEIISALKSRNPGFQGNSAARFTALSAAHYCPKYVSGDQ